MEEQLQDLANSRFQDVLDQSTLATCVHGLNGRIASVRECALYADLIHWMSKVVADPEVEMVNFDITFGRKEHINCRIQTTERWFHNEVIDKHVWDALNNYEGILFTADADNNVLRIVVGERTTLVTIEL